MSDLAIARCHCGGVVTWIGFKKQQADITKGEELIQNYQSSSHTWRKFCKICGTRMAFESSRNANWAEEFHLPLALFLTPVDREPHVNSFAEERPEWAPYHQF